MFTRRYKYEMILKQEVYFKAYLKIFILLLVHSVFNTKIKLTSEYALMQKFAGSRS